MVFQRTRVHPRRRLDASQPIDEALRVGRDARRRGDCREVRIGKQIGGDRLKSGPHRRSRGGSCTGADDGDWLARYGLLSDLPSSSGRSGREIRRPDTFDAFLIILARIALETSIPSSFASANE